MIVKDESHVILRVLKSISPHIDYWAIVDTGSTDGCQQVIKDYFAEKNIPGELIEMPWVDFSTCRNVALNAVESKTDYGIWIDADEEFIPDEGFNMEGALSQDFDCVAIKTKYNQVEYTRKNIWKCKNNFSWVGPIHEVLGSPNEKKVALLENAHVLVRPEGNSWKNVTEKYRSHAKVLSAYTEVDKDPRWIFYTAQSYRDAGDFKESIEWYKKRAAVKEGFLEEIYMSRLMIAKLTEITGGEKGVCLNLYYEAHTEDPVRGEAMKAIVQLCQRCKDWEMSYVYSQYGLRYNQKNPYPYRILFVDQNLYNYEMLELHSLSCFYTKRHEEGSFAYWKMREQLKPSMISEEQMKIILDNEKYFPRISPPTPMVRKTAGSKFSPPKKKRKR
jgi:glycosyltransferase involved in cell wall biosynthesis